MSYTNCRYLNNIHVLFLVAVVVVDLFIIVTCVYIVHIYIYKQLYIVNTPSPVAIQLSPNHANTTIYFAVTWNRCQLCLYLCQLIHVILVGLLMCFNVS